MNDNEVMNHQQKDTNLRKALAHREGRRPVMPADLNERVMASVANDGHRGRVVRRWIAAACVLVVAGIGVTLMVDKKGSGEEMMTAKVENVSFPTPSPAKDKKEDAAPSTTIKKNSASLGSSKNGTDNSENASPSPVKVLKKESVLYPSSIQEKKSVNLDNERRHEYEIPVTTPYPMTNGDVGYLRYASATTDSVTYRSPSLFDEFIAKMADYNGVERVSLDCADNREVSISGNGRKDKGSDGGSSKKEDNKTKVESAVYVFPVNNEVDVFGRLLQMACWYDSKTPGYLLSFSRQQFFFCINDVRQGEKYLWTAERIAGDRILVYSTHSPMEVAVSSTCYQEYKEQLNIRKLKN